MKLTKAQQALMDALSEGLSNKEIATRLGVSASSIKQRIRRMTRVMHIGEKWHPRVRLIYLDAVKKGLIDKFRH